MIAIFDVQYYDDTAHAACVLCDNLMDDEAKETVTLDYPNPLPYESGSFYKRELPIILALIQKIGPERIDLCVVDGYVRFSEDHYGLGYHLWKETQKPVIGVAKTKYLSESISTPVYRGESKNPLYITTVGCLQPAAALIVEHMDGNYRIPTLIKLVDKEARS